MLTYQKKPIKKDNEKSKLSSLFEKCFGKGEAKKLQSTECDDKTCRCTPRMMRREFLENLGKKGVDFHLWANDDESDNTGRGHSQQVTIYSKLFESVPRYSVARLFRKL